MMTILCGLGMCVMAVWLAHGVIKPSKFRLSGSPGRANTLTPIHILLVFLVWQLTPKFALDAFNSVFQLGPTQTTIIVGITIQLTALLAGLAVAAYSFDNGVVRGMGFTPRRWFNDSIRSVVGVTAILPVCIFLLLVATWLILRWEPDRVVTHQFLKILTNRSTPQIWRALAVLIAVVLAPLGEEVLFRGLLQSMFRRYLHSPWAAVICTSILFAAVHFTVLQSLPALFALSLALGYNYERTGRLYSPIMIHMLFNSVMIVEALLKSP
jgi:membrane protease YdiL (CAAX protease family)